MKLKKVIGGILFGWGLLTITPPYIIDLTDSVMIFALTNFAKMTLKSAIIWTYIIGFALLILGAEMLGIDLKQKLKKVFKI